MAQQRYRTSDLKTTPLWQWSITSSPILTKARPLGDRSLQRTADNLPMCCFTCACHVTTATHALGAQCKHFIATKSTVRKRVGGYAIGFKYTKTGVSRCRSDRVLVNHTLKEARGDSRPCICGTGSARPTSHCYSPQTSPPPPSHEPT